MSLEVAALLLYKESEQMRAVASFLLLSTSFLPWDLLPPGAARFLFPFSCSLSDSSVCVCACVLGEEGPKL